ncbi:hypothetical protein ECH_0344 [Ehrlichia chaffeensis str. Arkansas]|uniref:Uncharacterized protein n=1 Tax=Ehrlichia chaffeensis (strain ATCC CRL-10679 / Arkansas) TaxID=205920 RepID=Q2GHB9_EHRCR|nr:hypothetical protein ECH_0344 [Ehrlichia chaffeensis str. Arkansas]
MCSIYVSYGNFGVQFIFVKYRKTIKVRYQLLNEKFSKCIYEMLVLLIVPPPASCCAINSTLLIFVKSCTESISLYI